MTNKPVKYLYLDVGGVVISDFSGTSRWDAMLTDLGITDALLPKFRDIWASHKHEINSTYDIELVANELQRELGLTLPEDFNFNDAFVSRFTPNPHIIGPITTARKLGINVGLLTNMYIGMFERIAKAGILPDTPFDHIIDSSVVKTAKPDPEIYRIAQKHAGVPHDEILFADNLEKNIEAAAELGWKTFFFDATDLEGSSKRLEEFLIQSNLCIMRFPNSSVSG